MGEWTEDHDTAGGRFGFLAIAVAANDAVPREVSESGRFVQLDSPLNLRLEFLNPNQRGFAQNTQLCAQNGAI